MSFPVTIDAALSSAEQPAKYGPFLIGSDRFEILLLVDTVAVTARLAAKKSSDGGLTWVEVDSANAPAVTWSGSNPALIPYACCQAGSLLYVVFYDQSQGFLMVTFGPAWGTPATVDPPPSNPTSGEGGFFLYQIAFAHSSFDSTLLLVLAGDRVALDDVNHQICAFARYDIGGASWSAWVDLGYLDYSDTTTWDQVPCGLVIQASTGRAIVFMQQVARAGPGDEVITQITAPGAFSINLPGDVPATGAAKLWGGGGGGNPGDDVGSGGGAGAFKAGTVNLTPGGTLDGVVGDGGTSGNDGEPTTCQTLTADPGLAGSSGASAPGGLGGVGDHDGGDGGDAGPSDTGGGGGGSPTELADGSPGSIGGATNGGGGGAGKASGGAGGNDTIFNPPTGGQPGGQPGAGGGGHGGADISTPGGNDGGVGQFDVAWISVRNTNDCRMFQQLINPDNTLGTLTEITQGAYPSRTRGAQPIPITFDASIAGSQVAIAFTGAASTSGRDNISVGRGAFADGVGFSFQTFSCGNGGNDVDSSPALAQIPGTVFCCYISSPTGSSVAFVFRSDTGAGFGAPVTIGLLSPGVVYAYSRLQANVLVAVPEITWGTPTAALNVRSHPV